MSMCAFARWASGTTSGCCDEALAMIGYAPNLQQLTSELRDQIVQRIISAADPDKIILFGSRARGTHRPDSDIDLLVVQNSEEPRHKRARPIHLALSDLPIEVDTDVLVF